MNGILPQIYETDYQALPYTLIWLEIPINYISCVRCVKSVRIFNSRSRLHNNIDSSPVGRVPSLYVLYGVKWITGIRRADTDRQSMLEYVLALTHLTYLTHKAHLIIEKCDCSPIFPYGEDVLSCRPIVYQIDLF